MRTVWKFNLPLGDIVEVELPVGAKILHIAEQGPWLCMWALVDPQAALAERRRFRIAGTGHDIVEENLTYIGTFLMRDGALVFHVFEIEKPMTDLNLNEIQAQVARGDWSGVNREVIRALLDRLSTLGRTALRDAEIAHGWVKRAEAAKARVEELTKALDERTDSLRTLRDAWNAHMATCPPGSNLPTLEQIEAWRDAPSNTASSLRRSCGHLFVIGTCPTCREALAGGEKP